MRLALSPNYPAVYLPTLGNAYRTCGATEEAIAASRPTMPEAACPNFTVGMAPPSNHPPWYRTSRGRCRRASHRRPSDGL